jgi:DUF1680 family protein
MRGPVVYCMESVDLPAGVKLSEVRLPRRLQLTTERTVAAVYDRRNQTTIGGQRPPLQSKGQLGDIVVIKGVATRLRQPDWDGQLYRDLAPGKAEKLPVTFIPYHAWANSGVTEMNVWLPAE